MFMFHHHSRLVEMYICVYTILCLPVFVCVYIQLQHFYASKSRNKQPTCFELILNNMQVKFLVPGERGTATRIITSNTINNTEYSADFTYASFFISKSIDACIRSFDLTFSFDRCFFSTVYSWYEMFQWKKSQKSINRFMFS